MPSSLAKTIRRYSPLRYDQWGRNPQDNSQPPDDGKVHEPKKPNQQPPDLDKLWNNFTSKLDRMFRRKKHYGGRDPGDEYDGRGGFDRGWIGLILVIVLVIFFWMSSGFFIVQEGQAGIVMHFGKYSHTASPGFNWRWPYPIQSHEVVNLSRVRTVEVGYRSALKNKQPREASMLTSDENIIEIQFDVQYHVKNASHWVFNIRDQEDALVRQIAESAMREAVGRYGMDYVMNEGRDKIASEVQKQIQGIFDQYQAGLQIDSVAIQGVQPPDQVQAAFDEAGKAGQDRKRLNSEGQAYADDVIPKAKGAASRLLQDAEGYRSRVIANAEGDTIRFKQILAEYQKAPVVTRDRMYLETMQQIFSNTSKVVVDTKGGNSTLYLPLDKLMAQTAAQSAPQAAPQSAPASAPAASSSAAPAPAPAVASPAPAPSTAAPAPSSRGRDTREREVR